MVPEEHYIRQLTVLKDAGFTPGAIIDIGVAMGTEGLYRVWPEAPLCLIEPSHKAQKALAEFAARRPGVHLFHCGASDREGEVEVNEDSARPYVAFGGRKPKWPTVKVRIRPCDDIVREAGLTGPFVYKLDTDTHDWEALHGSEWTLSQSTVVSVEFNVFYQFRGMATPDQIWRFLTDRGFTFFDVCPGGYGDNRALRCMDFIFVRADAPVFRNVFEGATKPPRPRAFDKATS